MAGYFFDTSALVKYYHVENGTVEVTRIISDPANQVRLSTLGILEAQSAFAMKVRSGILDRHAAGTLRAGLMLDIAAGRLQPYSLSDEHFEAAERLIGRHAFSLRLRTLDALHLAVALDLRDQGLIERFVAADRALCEAAALDGMSVLNPDEANNAPEADVTD